VNRAAMMYGSWSVSGAPRMASSKKPLSARTKVSRICAGSRAWRSARNAVAPRALPVFRSGARRGRCTGLGQDREEGVVRGAARFLGL